MKVHAIIFNPFYENTYILSNELNQAIIIDPGCYEPYEIQELQNYITQNNLEVIAIVNTHCHIDHVLGNWALKKNYKVDLWVPKNEEEVWIDQSRSIKSPSANSSRSRR